MTEQNNKTENAIVAQNMRLNGGGLELKNLQDMKLAAETFIKSGLVPQHFNTPAKVIVALQAGAELGLRPFQSLQNLNVVNGKVGISATMIGGLIRKHVPLAYFKKGYEGEKYNDDYQAVVRSRRKGEPEDEVTTFSVADAKTAGLWGKGGAWKNYPDDMLMWRALSRHGRRYFGEVLGGLYTEEELEEINEPQAQPGPSAPSRNERRQVEATVTDAPKAEQPQTKDTKKATAEVLQRAVDSFEKQLEGSVEPAQFRYLFSEYAAAVLGHNAEKWQDAESWTLENAQTLLDELQSSGVPDWIQAQATPQEADQQQEDEQQPDGELFGEDGPEQSYKPEWECNGCAACFEKPKHDKAKGVLVCPECSSANIVHHVEEVSADAD